jgi:hypothetical protein
VEAVDQAHERCFIAHSLTATMRRLPTVEPLDELGSNS